MSDTKNPDEFYKKLLIQLNDTTKFPEVYLYKFIVPSVDDKTAQVIAKFDDLGATIKTKKSKTGKYTSISIHVKMDSAVAVIEKYKEVGMIAGVISL